MQTIGSKKNILQKLIPDRMPPVIPTALLGRVRFSSGPPHNKCGDLFKSGALLFMAFYVYILHSEFDGRFYKGFSENPLERLHFK